MADLHFNCPHCGQNLDAPEEMAGETIDCPVCQKSFQIPGGLIEVPSERMAPPPRPSGPSAAASSSDDKGKTVRIELPPEVFEEPEKHIFKIKRIKH
ncbi:MAG: hypothetical protein LBN38_05330 [Verrucomicrobiota bacterium]|jgi:hypothetical protein|nr:hypothetical protein [Verrucomicrobiota bacterium]